MFIADGVSSVAAVVSVSAVVVLAFALRRSRQSEQRAWDVSLVLMAQCGHLMRCEIQAQEAAKSTSLQLGEMQAQNQQLKTEIESAQDEAAEAHETVRILTGKLNASLFEVDQLTATYALMKADLKREAAAAASHEVAHLYWEAEARRLRGSVDELNSEIADERAAEVQSGIAEAVVTHAVSLATGG